MSVQELPGGRQPYSMAFGGEIRAFLQSSQQRVLLIHGRWGTGKTYFWKRFVEQNSRAIIEAYYSYVSLFGSTSLSDIKSLVIFGGDPLRAARGLEDVIDRVKNRFARVRKRFGKVNVPYVGNLAAILPSFEELLIKDYLVCFDDLERRNRQLDLEQFFGLVSVLKEQNNCRIVIVCNEEELSPRDRRVLAKYREKIVDRQLTFGPPFDENFGLIFSADDKTTREVCVHYAFSKQLTLEQVRNEPWFLANSDRRVDIQSESSRLIEQLQFSPSDADDFIIDYLRNGYCDIVGLKGVIARLNENFSRGEADAAMRRIWELVYDDFQADIKTIENATSKCMDEFRAYLRIDSLKYLLDFLHEIDPDFDKSHLLQEIALETVQTADVEILQQVQAAKVSETVQSAVVARRIDLLPARSVGDLIAALSHPGGWNPKDFLALNAYSDAELHDWVLDAKGSRLIGDIAVVVVRARTSSLEEGGRPVAEKLQRVMGQVADRSKLDEFRVRRYFVERVRKGLAERGIKEPEVT